MGAIGDLVANLSLNPAPFQRGAQQAQGTLSTLGTGFTSTLSGITARIGAVLGVTSLLGSLTWGATLAGEAEQAQISFEVMLGSAAKARDMLAEIQAYADKSPYGGAGVRDSAQMLLNFGLEAGKILPTVRMLGDVASGDQQKLSSLALVFGQMSSAGRLMGQDLLQFINSGFNPLQEIAKKTGESMGDLRKRMEGGGVSAREVEDAFKSATSEGGRFFQMTERQSQTMTGKFSTLKDGIANALRTISQNLMQSFELSTVLDRLNEGVGQIPFYFQNAGILLQTELLGWQLYFDELVPGSAQVMQDVGIIFQTGWAGITVFFTSFFDTVKAGFQEIRNLAEATMAGMAVNKDRSWLEFIGVEADAQFKDTLQYVDTINAMLGGSDTFFQGAMGVKPWQQNEGAMAGADREFNRVLAGQQDAMKPGEDAFSKATKAYTDKFTELIGKGGSAGSLPEQIAAQRAELMWRIAEMGDQSGYGSAQSSIGDAPPGTEPPPPGTKGKGKADNARSEAALMGSAAAARLMTSGTASPMKKTEELSATQLKVQQQMLNQLKENQRQAAFNMPLQLANF